MASIHRENNKPNWFCHYYDPEGYRRKRSTGTKNAKIARTICQAVERAADLTRAGKLTTEKGLKLVREVSGTIGEAHGKLAAAGAESVLTSAVEEFIRTAGGEFNSYTIRSWFTNWIDGRTDASTATVVEYRRIIELFLTHLGTRSDRVLTTLENRQIEEFKGYLKKRVAPSTVNKGVKVLKAALNDAVKKRVLEFNPAQHVESVQIESAGLGLTNDPFNHPAAFLTPHVIPNVPKQIDSATGLPAGNMLVDPSTGLPLPPKPKSMNGP